MRDDHKAIHAFPDPEVFDPRELPLPALVELKDGRVIEATLAPIPGFAIESDEDFEASDVAHIYDIPEDASDLIDEDEGVEA